MAKTDTKKFLLDVEITDEQTGTFSVMMMKVKW